MYPYFLFHHVAKYWIIINFKMAMKTVFIRNYGPVLKCHIVLKR